MRTFPGEIRMAAVAAGAPVSVSRAAGGGPPGVPPRHLPQRQLWATRRRAGPETGPPSSPAPSRPDASRSRRFVAPFRREQAIQARPDQPIPWRTCSTGGTALTHALRPLEPGHGVGVDPAEEECLADDEPVAEHAARPDGREGPRTMPPPAGGGSPDEPPREVNRSPVIGPKVPHRIRNNGKVPAARQSTRAVRPRTASTSLRAWPALQPPPCNRR